MSDEVSQLLPRWREGDTSTLAPLMPIVDGELRRRWRSTIPNRRRDTILQPTMLIYAAWLWLVLQLPLLETRAQFYALAAKLMHDTPVEQLRRQQALKCGGREMGLSLEDGQACCLGFQTLDETLRHRVEMKPHYARIIELRYLAGLTIAATAEVPEISHPTVEREWHFPRLLLRRELRHDSPSGGNTPRRPT